jgi:drug/metabolite transporter (DMT)-like permease
LAALLSTPAVIALTLLAAAIAAFAQYLYKTSVKKFGFSARELWAAFTNRRLLLGISVYVASLLVYLYALRAAPVISFVYPIFASTFIFVFLISHLVLKERIGRYRALGMLLVVLGIAIISVTM